MLVSSIARCAFLHAFRTLVGYWRASRAAASSYRAPSQRHTFLGKRGFSARDRGSETRGAALVRTLSGLKRLPETSHDTMVSPMTHDEVEVINTPQVDSGRTAWKRALRQKLSTNSTSAPSGGADRSVCVLLSFFAYHMVGQFSSRSASLASAPRHQKSVRAAGCALRGRRMGVWDG